MESEPQRNVFFKRTLEKGEGIRSGLKDLPHYLNAGSITSGFIAAIFGCTGPILVVISAAMNAGFTTEQTISWLISVYFFGGLTSIILSLKYKMPINGAWSMPAAVLLGVTLPFFTINQAVGAYFLAGFFVLIMGLTGINSSIMKLIPFPVVMGMVAGSMIKFGVNIITSLEVLPLVSAAALGGYLIFTWAAKKVPSILGALFFGLVAAALTGNIDLSTASSYSFIGPQLIRPEFSIDAFFSMTVPIIVLSIGVNNAQAVGVLLAQGYKPPINFMTVVTGLMGILASFFGGHNVSIAGPMTAICCSDAPGISKEGRYASSFANGIFFVLFGIFASVAVVFINSFPKTIIEVIAGLAMVGVLIQAFEGAFGYGKKYQLGAFFALIISMSDVTLLKVSSPFWGLIAGTLIYLLTKNND